MTENPQTTAVALSTETNFPAVMQAAKRALAAGTKAVKKTYPLRELEIGQSITSVFLGRKLQSESVDAQTGEVKERFFVYLADPKDDSIFKVWENGPLRNALTEADVVPGTLFTVKRLEKKKTTLSTGPKAGTAVEINQYEIEVIPL